jgi:hypothetical protein
VAWLAADLRARFFNRSRINSVIKSSCIITEGDRGCLGRAVVVPHRDEIIKGQLQCVLSADRALRDRFARHTRPLLTPDTDLW